jgi:hypothetical protein
LLVVLKTSFEDHLKEDRLGLEGAMSAAPAKIVASVFKILNSRILVGEMIALDQWELLPIWELPLPVSVTTNTPVVLKMASTMLRSTLSTFRRTNLQH